MQKTPPSIFSLPLDQIFEMKDFNIRIEYGDIDELAVRLMTEGQLEAIRVKKGDGGRFFVTKGHRRRRAFIRARDLRIEKSGDKLMVLEGVGVGERKLREAPGEVHRNFTPDRMLCILEDEDSSETEIFKNQLSYGSGKPYTALEKMLFIGRLRRGYGLSTQAVIAETGLSRTYVRNAESLNTADERLLKFVSEGRISQKLALQLLRKCNASEQVAKIREASSRATTRNRDDDKLLPKDFVWKDETPDEGPPVDKPTRHSLTKEPMRQRFRTLLQRLQPQLRRPPNKVSADRLAVVMLLDRYLTKKAACSDLEAFLLGRE